MPDVIINEVDVNIHRLASRPDKTPGTVVLFVHKNNRNQWRERCLSLKKWKSIVYIQENLIKQDEVLFLGGSEGVGKGNKLQIPLTIFVRNVHR